MFFRSSRARKNKGKELRRMAFRTGRCSLVVLFLSLLLSFSSIFRCVSAAWTTLCSEANPEGCEKDFVQRRGHSLTRLNESAHVLWGGGFIKMYRNQELPDTSRMGIYDAQTGSFNDVNVSGDAPQVVEMHTSVLLGGDMIVFGGMNSTTGATVEPEVFLLDTVSWRWLSSDEYLVDATSAPPKLRSHASTVMGASMFVVGGFAPDRKVEWCGECSHTNDVYAFFEEDEQAPDGKRAFTWTMLDAVSLVRLPPRHGHTVVAKSGANNELIVFGGYGYNTQRPTPFQGDVEYYQDIWKFDVDALVWSEIKVASSSQLPPRRMAHVAEMHAGKMYIHGGYSVLMEGDKYKMRTYRDEKITFFDDLWRFDFGTSAWTQLTLAGGDAPSARAWHAWAFYTPNNNGGDGDTEIHVVGGIVQHPMQGFSDIMTVIKPELHKCIIQNN